MLLSICVCVCVFKILTVTLKLKLITIHLFFFLKGHEIILFHFSPYLKFVDKHVLLADSHFKSNIYVYQVLEI